MDNEVTPKVLRITLVKSPIGYSQRHRATVTSLGLRKIRQTVELIDTPQLRGMLYFVNHLVQIEEVLN
jgi:large subunit ribosomal protein L30